VSFVDYKDVSSRLEITITLVLTSVAIKLTASDWIPNVAYLTLLVSTVPYTAGEYSTVWVQYLTLLVSTVPYTAGEYST
jgi:hypothetical protein